MLFNVPVLSESFSEKFPLIPTSDFALSPTPGPSGSLWQEVLPYSTERSAAVIQAYDIDIEVYVAAGESGPNELIPTETDKGFLLNRGGVFAPEGNNSVWARPKSGGGTVIYQTFGTQKAEAA